jgi:hypothetical protein
MVTDPGDAATIVVDRYGAVVPMVSGSAGETRTLAVPTKAGILATLVHDTDGGGAITLTVTSGYNADAQTSIVFSDAGDFVTLLSVKIGDNYRWRVVGSEGTNLQQEAVTADNVTVNDTLSVTNAVISYATITNPKHVVTAVTAVGSVQSLATNSLSPGFNNIAGGGSNLGVSLPTAAAGLECIIKNTSGSTAIVYTHTQAAIINALATSTGFSVADTKTIRLICENSTQWWTDPLAIA